MKVSERVTSRLAIACVAVSIAFIALWFVGQEASADPSLDVPWLVARLYPGTWHPFARGMLWLFVAATAVGFDMLVAYPRARTRAGRAGAAALAGVTGACFLAFAAGSFAGADWSVIH